MAGWKGVVEWRQVYRRALLWSAGIEASGGPGWFGSGSPIGAGYALDLVEVGYRVRTAWDRGCES